MKEQALGVVLLHLPWGLPVAPSADELHALHVPGTAHRRAAAYRFHGQVPLPSLESHVRVVDSNDFATALAPFGRFKGLLIPYKPSLMQNVVAPHSNNQQVSTALTAGPCTRAHRFPTTSHATSSLDNSYAKPYHSPLHPSAT